MKRFEIDRNGFYGEIYGGAFVSGNLENCLEELQIRYRDIMESDIFKKEYIMLLKDYVGRPTPLYHAAHLSEKYGAEIYLKREDLNHTGAHKINNAIGQALVAKMMGKRRIVAETGAGQHGVAVATACALMGLDCRIFMGAKDMMRQNLNVGKMKMLGAEVVPVHSGSQILSDAVDEALRQWSCDPEGTFYILGSAVGPHPYPDMVARLQSVISKEIKKQLMEKTGREYPDYLIACVGGGSNASGTVFHYLEDDRVNIVLAEAAGKGLESGMSAATVNLGVDGIFHGFRSLVIKDEHGNIKEPYSISAGLDYPGIGPLFAYMHHCSRAEFLGITDDEALEAAYILASSEGIIPAIESSHALAVLPKISFRQSDVVVVTVSGRGDKDMDCFLQSMSL